MPKVQINNPNQPRGAELEIPGLGMFKNGSPTEVSEEQVENWRWYNQRGVVVGERPEDGVAVVEYQRGPTLKQAFENVDYIEVLDDEPQKESKSKTSAPVESESAEAAAAETKKG